MLSLQCRAPGLRAAETPSCLSSTHSSLLPGKALKKSALYNLVLRVGVKVSYPASDLTQEGEKSEVPGRGVHSCVYRGVNRA